MSETTEKLLDIGTNYLSQIIEAAKQAVPIATQITLQTVSFSNLVWVITGFVMLGLASCFGYLGYRVIKEALRIHDLPGRSYYAYDGFGHLTGGIVSLIMASLCLICSLIHLLSIWHWVGIWHPDIYLVHEAIVRVTNK